MSKVLRTLKTGGQSLCSAPDELVGRGRCRHVLDDSSDIAVKINKSENCVYIEIKDDNTEISMKAKEEKVTNFIKELSKGLPKDKTKAILDHLRD